MILKSRHLVRSTFILERESGRLVSTGFISLYIIYYESRSLFAAVRIQDGISLTIYNLQCNYKHLHSSGVPLTALCIKVFYYPFTISRCIQHDRTL